MTIAIVMLAVAAVMLLVTKAHVGPIVEDQDLRRPA